MSCSAMPTSTKRSALVSSNARMRQSEARSASSTTRRRLELGEPDAPSPYASTTYSAVDRRRPVRRPDSGSPTSDSAIATAAARPAPCGVGRARGATPLSIRPASSANAVERVVVRRTGVPAIGPSPSGKRPRVLHERDAPALDRLARPGPSVDQSTGREGGEHRPQRRVVVSVAGRDVPAERPELLLEVVEGDDLLGRPVRLELVSVDNHPRLPETLLCCTLERLPVLALLELPVTRHHHDAAAPAEVALCPGDPAALRDAHAERAGVRLDSGHRRCRDGRRGLRAAGVRAGARAAPGRARRAPRTALGTSCPFDVKNTSRSGCVHPSLPCSAPRRAGWTTTSSALKLEPMCPEPARLTATSAFSAAHVGEQGDRLASASPCDGTRSNSAHRDQLEARHAGR